MKASEEARKLRELKKFGKKVQVEKIREREREKKAVGERLESLKKSTSPIQLFQSILALKHTDWRLDGSYRAKEWRCLHFYRRFRCRFGRCFGSFFSTQETKDERI